MNLLLTDIRKSVITFLMLVVIASLFIVVRSAQAQCCNLNTNFGWDEGAHIRITAVWNAQHRAGGAYSPAAWPRGSLATDRALLFAARQVLRDEWDINSVIATNHAGGGFVQLAEAETNYWQQHEDYPPHVHINYIWPGWSGHVNTHFYTSESGKVKQPLVLWNVPGCATGEKQPAAGVWWAEIDENCQPVWYQRWTSDGAIELRLTPTAPIYRLVAGGIGGDLASAHIYLENQHIYSVNIALYDPINLQMIVKVADYRTLTATNEVLAGSASSWDRLTVHTTSQAAVPALPDPISVNPADGRIAVTWPDDPATEWVQMWIGPHPVASYFQWLGRRTGQDQFTCDGTQCVAYLNWHQTGTTNLSLWMRAWGRGGFSGTGPLDNAPDWNQVSQVVDAAGTVVATTSQFDLPTTPPIATTDLGVTDNTALDLEVIWTGQPDTTWYHLVIYDPIAIEIHYNGWHQAMDTCAGKLVDPPDYTCAINGLGLNPTLASGTDYEIYIQSWGPGGFSTGGNVPGFDGWSAGSFTYSPA